MKVLLNSTFSLANTLSNKQSKMNYTTSEMQTLPYSLEFEYCSVVYFEHITKFDPQ